MKEIWKRFWAETPKFFVRLRAFGLSLSAVGTSIVAISGVPEAVKTYGGHAIWVGLVLAAVSQLTVTDTKVLQK